MSPPLVATQSYFRSRQNILFPILDVLLNLFNWGFHVLVSWYLLPPAYGELNSLLALLSLAMVLGVALQVLTARQVAADGPGSIPSLRRLALFLASAFCGLSLLCLPLLMWLTRASPVCILLVLLTFAINAILSVERGITQGQTTFLSLNGSFYLEVVVKLVATGLFLSLWRTPEAALLGVATGMAASLWASSKGATNDDAERSSKVEPLRPWLYRLIPVFAASFFLYFFSSVDMLLVNRLLPAESGIYAVTVKYGQILFFAALSVGTVFIPKLSQARGDTEHFKSLSLRLVGLLAIFNVLALIASWGFLPLTVAPVFGHSYVNAGSLLPLAIFAYGLLALSFCLVNVLVVLEERSYLLILLSSSVLVVFLLIWRHSSLGMVLQALAINHFLLFICLFLMVSFKLKEINHVTHS